MTPSNQTLDASRVNLLRDRVRRDPTDGHAWLALAEGLASGPPTPELSHAMEQAIRSLPGHEPAWLLAARIQQRQRGSEAAAAWLEAMARSNPELAAPRRAASTFRAECDEAIRSRADALRDEARWSEALEAYLAIEPRHPADPYLQNNIGTCLASLDAVEDAAGRFRAALRGDPDLVEARLNLALLDASGGRVESARSALRKAVSAESADPKTRGSARRLLELLDERERLQPALIESLRTETVLPLYHALRAAPEGLSRPDPDSLERLEIVGRRLRELRPAPEAFRQQAPIAPLLYLEARAHANLPDDDEAVRKGWRRLRRPGEGEADPEIRDLRRWLGVIRARADRSANRLHSGEGEAWIRYWHARLMRAGSGRAAASDGHFKLGPNAIKRLPLTPPERVAGTYRQALAGLLPSVAAGPERATLAYVAVNMIHGFDDGNGRLSRFVLGWILETAGLPSVAVPPGLRAPTAEALDLAWMEGDAKPILDAIRAAHAETARRLRLLG